MTAFPSSSSDIVTTNLDSASDKPKDARQDLFNALTKLKTVIDSFNANSGICGLNADAKVDSAKLAGQVIKASLGADCVDGTKIEDDSIDSEHIVDGSVDYQHISFGSTSTSLGTSNALVPTQGAVKNYVDTTATTLQTNIDNTSVVNTAIYTGSDISQTTSGDPSYTLTEVSDPSSMGTVSGSEVTVSAGYYSVQATFSLKNTTNSSGNYTGQIVTNINSAGESAQEFGQADPVQSNNSNSFLAREIKPVTIDASAGSTTIRLKFSKVSNASCQTQNTILYITKLA